MSTAEQFIYFGCPQCTSPLRAPARSVGKRQRCPRCQFVVEVPAKSRRTDFEEYGFNENAADANAEPEVAFACPVCRTRMTAPKEQIGQKQNCPDCRTPVTVPAPLPERLRKQAAPVEAYTVSEEFNPAAPVVPQVEYIAVHCGRCGTLMQIKPDRVGSKVQCPDCQKIMVVEAPHEHRKLEASSTTDSYAVSEESVQPPPDSVANQEHVSFHCDCGTRLQSLVREAGQQVTCPDCGRGMIVPPPRRKRPKPDLSKEIDGEYETPLDSAGEEQTSATFQPPLWFSDRFRKMLDAKGESTAKSRPPPMPLISGVFDFPWRRGCLEKWIWLSAGATLFAEMGVFGWNLGRGIGLSAGIGASGPAVLSMLFMLLAGVLGVCWAGVFIINLLTILGDTAAGADEVGHWPEAVAFIDWVGNTFFVVNSLVLSVLVGQGVGWLLRQVQLPGIYAMIGVPAVLFPFVLLSMLEANSPLVPISKVMFDSLDHKWRDWSLFYLESILLMAVIGVSGITAMLLGNPFAAIHVLAITAVTCLMIYFRLLGRLAWCCAR
jgi:DNA-directed RNA polymerase subunit M/transcription elongation factor TFIIS